MKYFSKDNLYIKEQDFSKLNEIRHDILKLKYHSENLFDKISSENDFVEVEVLANKLAKCKKCIKIFNAELDKLVNEIKTEDYQNFCKQYIQTNEFHLDKF